MKEHIYGYAAILATLLSLPTLAAKLRKDDPARDEDIDVSPLKDTTCDMAEGRSCPSLIALAK